MWWVSSKAMVARFFPSLIRMHMNNREKEELVRRPPWALPLALGYAVLLVCAVILDARSPAFAAWLPHPLGPIPLGMIWWGALGGTVISLDGILAHSQDWDHRLDAWHIARPLLGAVAGAVGYLILLVVVRGAVGAALTPTSGRLEFDLVAFILGFREETFRTLLRRAADMLLSPGPTHAEKPSETRPNQPM